MTPFCNKKQSQEIVNTVMLCETAMKTFIVRTNTVKSIRMKEVNKQLHNSLAKIRSFPGVALKNLKYYCVLSLIDEMTGIFCIEKFNSRKDCK